MVHGDPLGTEEKKSSPTRFFNKFTIIVTISGADFQSMIDGEIHRKEEGVRERRGGR
jgi:hypothetical protein